MRKATLERIKGASAEEREGRKKADEEAKENAEEDAATAKKRICSQKCRGGSIGGSQKREEEAVVKKMMEENEVAPLVWLLRPWLPQCWVVKVSWYPNPFQLSSFPLTLETTAATAIFCYR